MGKEKTYKILAAHSKKALTLSYNRALQTVSDTGNAAVRWQIQYFPDSTVSFVSMPTGEAIELDEIMDQVLPYITVRDTANLRQRFKLLSNADRSVSLVSLYSGYCIDVADAETRDFAVITTWPREDHPNQKWNLIRNGDEVMFTSKLNNKYLAPTPPLDKDGANIGQWPFENRPEQLWILKKQKNDTYVLQNVFSGKYLQESDGTLSLKHNVQLHASIFDSTSFWYLDEGKNASVKFRNLATGLCLDVRDAFPYNGANVMTYDCGAGIDNQLWFLEEVTGG